MQTNADPGAAANPALTEKKPSLTTASVVVTLHTMLDLPRKMSQLDARKETFEVVLQPRIKYYKNDRRLTQLQLPEATVPFSPSSILFKHERFVVDFEEHFQQGAEPYTRGSLGTSSPSLGSNTSSQLQPMAATFSDYDPAHDEVPRTQKAEEGCRAGGTQTPPISTAECVKQRGPHNIFLEFPTRADLKVLVEVRVGVRQRRIGSSAVRWITPPLDGDASRKEITMFSAAEGEVARYKVINRFVGLNIGHLSCSMTLPHAMDNLVHVPDSAACVKAAAERLLSDADRLRRLYAMPPASTDPAALVAFENEITPQRVTEALASGAESEVSLFKRMLLHYNPSYYLTRVQRILDMYPPTRQNLEWVKASAAELVANALGNEENLIRRLCAELGPELSSISPRIRLMVFCWFHKLRESDALQVIPASVDAPQDLKDYEPDFFMNTLVAHYGAELVPIRYNFPEIRYVPDERTSFSDALRFPVNGPDGRYRDIAFAAHEKRVPLQVTPNERPLQPQSSSPSCRKVGEIDILLEKYKPEFTQIIPSIADAMESVVQRNESLAPGASAAVTSDEFYLFQSRRTSYPYTTLLLQVAEYTYISPSSMLAAVIYLDRLCMRHPQLILSRYNIERLIVTAIRIASKVVDLRSINNKNFANVFSLSLGELNEMENCFLAKMDFDFFLSPEELNNYAALLRPPAACAQIRSSLRRSVDKRLDTALLQMEQASAESPTEGGSTKKLSDSGNYGTHSGSDPHETSQHITSSAGSASMRYTRQPIPPAQRPPPGHPARSSAPSLPSPECHAPQREFDRSVWSLSRTEPSLKSKSGNLLAHDIAITSLPEQLGFPFQRSELREPRVSASASDSFGVLKMPSQEPIPMRGAIRPLH